MVYDYCDHCEYGNRFKDMGKCSECGTGRIIADTHTLKIFCSNLHEIKNNLMKIQMGRQKCFKIVYGRFDVYIVTEQSYENLKKLSKVFEKTPVQIYKNIKKRTPALEKISFEKLTDIAIYLLENEIMFEISPDVTIMYKFHNCFPKLSENYNKWIYTYLENKKNSYFF